MLEDGTLKRIYSSSSTLIDLTYYINPISEKAIFYLNSNKLPKIYKKDKVFIYIINNLKAIFISNKKPSL